MKRNILLVFLLVVISILLSYLLGGFINTRIFGLSGFEGFFVPTEIINFINSFPFLYIFLSPFLFISFGKGKKILWSVLSILPILYFLFDIESGTKIWFWSIIFFASGAIIANVVNFFKNRA